MREDTLKYLKALSRHVFSLWPAVFFAMGFMALMNFYGFMDRILDARFYYTGPEATDYLRGLSESDRWAYLRQEYLDLGFILSYSTAFYFLMKKLFRRRDEQTRLWLAFIPGAFDLGETLGIIYMLSNEIARVPDWLGVMTGLKWTSGALLVFYALSVKAQETFRHRSL